MKFRLLITIATILIVYSCATKSNVPTESVKKVELTPELAEGKQLYENNCGNCHRLYDAIEFSSEQWKPIVLRMQKKAKLDEVQGQKIFHYLTMK